MMQRNFLILPFLLFTATHVVAMNKSPDKEELFITHGEYKSTALIDAVKKNDEAEVQRLLNDPIHRATIDFQDSEGARALRHACKKKYENIIKLLIEAKANICDDPGIFASACLNGNSDAILQFLIDNKANIEEKKAAGYTPLFYAAINSWPSVVQFLIKSGADLNVNDYGRTIKDVSRCDKEFFENLKLYRYSQNRTDSQKIKDRKKVQEIVDAALAEQAKKANASIAAVVASAAPTPTPTPVATQVPTPIPMPDISPAKDAVKSKSKQPKEKDPKDKSAISESSEKQKSDVDVDEDGYTQLMLECRLGNLEKVITLLKEPRHRKTINYQSKSEKRTALLLACCVQNIDIIRLLLKNDANVNMVDVSDCSALSYAVCFNELEMVKLLLNACALNSENYKTIRNLSYGFPARWMDDKYFQENLDIRILLDEQADKLGLLTDAGRLILLKNKLAQKETKLKNATSNSEKRAGKRELKALKDVIDSLEQRIAQQDKETKSKEPSVPSAGQLAAAMSVVQESKSAKDNVVSVAAAAAVEVAAPAAQTVPSVKIMAMRSLGEVCVAKKGTNDSKKEKNAAGFSVERLEQTLSDALDYIVKNVKNKAKDEAVQVVSASALEVAAPADAASSVPKVMAIGSIVEVAAKDDPKEKNKDKVELDKDGKTPLIIACFQGNLKLVKELLKDPIHKSTIDQQDIGGLTALHHVCCTGNVSIAKLLLHKANINIPCNDGLTPLKHAIYYSQLEIVKLLINANAINSKNYIDYLDCANHHSDFLEDINRYHVEDTHLSFHPSGIELDKLADYNMEIINLIEQKCIELGFLIVEEKIPVAAPTVEVAAPADAAKAAKVMAMSPVVKVAAAAKDESRVNQINELKKELKKIKKQLKNKTKASKNKDKLEIRKLELQAGITALESESGATVAKKDEGSVS